jgi:hypothetical protein
MTQPDLFSTTVQPLFEEHRAEWLAWARRTAMEIAQRRGSVCIDDIRALCPLPENVDPRVCGAVFRTSDFIGGEYVNSGRAINHHRPIRLFRLRGTT